MYRANMTTHDYYQEHIDRIHESINREMPNRDARARKLMDQLKQERIDKNMPSPRPPILVSRKMKHLPPAALKPDVQ